MNTRVHINDYNEIDTDKYNHVSLLKILILQTACTFLRRVRDRKYRTLYFNQFHSSTKLFNSFRYCVKNVLLITTLLPLCDRRSHIITSTIQPPAVPSYFIRGRFAYHSHLVALGALIPCVTLIKLHYYRLYKHNSPLQDSASIEF